MRRFLVGSMVVLALAVVSEVPVDAAGFGGRTRIKTKSWCSKTVTTSIYTIDQWGFLADDGIEASATYTVTTVQVTIFWKTWTSTCTTLDVSISGLDSSYDGDTIGFWSPNPEGEDGVELGTDTQTNGAASLSLSSKRGDTIPDLTDGRDFFIGDDSEGRGLAGGYFQLTSQTTTSCGRSSTTID